MTRSVLRPVATVVLIALVALGCSSGDGDATPSMPTTDAGTTAGSRAPSGLGVVHETFVDTSRRTPKSRDLPAEPQRTLPTTTYYPAVDTPVGEVVDGATPDTAGGPYPLVVFSHGLGADPGVYHDMLEEVAAAGFVVMAPTFPRSGSSNPGGADAGDTGNQPGDVSFLIDTALAADHGVDSVLHDLVDAERIGAFGHSNGAITTLGLTANSCCRDDRIDAAIALSGTPSPFADGEYDFTDAPPMLLVHGTTDQLVPYESAKGVFNALDGAKGLLTLEGVDHSAFIPAGTPVHAALAAVLIDFLRAQLVDDRAALARLEAQPSAAGATLVWAGAGSGVTVATEAPRTGRTASADPTTGLRHEQVVTVSWSGFVPGQVVNVVQCSQGGTGGSEACDLTRGRILQPDPTGTGSLSLEVAVGAVGSGECDSSTSDCLIIVNDGGLQEPEATIRIPISFAAGPTGG